MLIVFQSLNFISLIPALMLGMVFDVYYLRSSSGIRQFGIFKRYQKRLPIQCLPLESADSLEGGRSYDYGVEAVVYRRVDQLLPQHMLQGLEIEFPGVARLNDKLKLTLASYLGYLDIGVVTLFLGSARKFRRVCFVHAAFGSYVHRISNIPDSVCLHHVFFPTDDLAGLFSKVVGGMAAPLRKLFAPRVPQVAEADVTTSQSHHLLDTAVAFHQSVGYGKMFRKLHYFSSNNRSRLHPSNVLNLVLDRQQPLSDTGRDEELVLRDLRRVSTRQNMWASVRFFLSKYPTPVRLTNLWDSYFWPACTMECGPGKWPFRITRG